MPGRDAGNLTGAGPGDPGALRTLGSSHVNMAMQALGRGRDGTALDLARRGTERYRELFDRFPRHSDNDIAGLFFSLANALDEAGLTIEAQTLLAEMPARARARYAEAPDIAAPGLVEVLEAQYQDALTTGRHDPAADYAAELRDPAKRHAGQPFSMAVTASVSPWPPARIRSFRTVMRRWHCPSTLHDAVIDPDGVDPVTVYFWPHGGPPMSSRPPWP